MEKKENKMQKDNRFESGLHEECGVFGAYDFSGQDVASSIYYGLFACSTVVSRHVGSL